MLSGELEQSSVRQLAVRHLAQTPNPISMIEWARGAGASQRTLEYGFLDIFEMAPNVYLRLNLLNKAHRDLAIADPEFATVTDIAMKWRDLSSRQV